MLNPPVLCCTKFFEAGSASALIENSMKIKMKTTKDVALIVEDMVTKLYLKFEYINFYILSSNYWTGGFPPTFDIPFIADTTASV